MEESFLHLWRSHIERVLFTLFEEPKELLAVDIGILALILVLFFCFGFWLGRRLGKYDGRMSTFQAPEGREFAPLEEAADDTPIPELAEVDSSAPPSSTQTEPSPAMEPAPVPEPEAKPSPELAPEPALAPAPESKAEPVPTPAPKKKVAWSAALQKSREPLLSRLQDAWTSLTGGETWSEDHPMWESLEEALITSDIGPQMTETLLDGLKQDFREKPTEKHLRDRLRSRMLEVFEKAPQESATAKEGNGSDPHITMLIGVNGSGKTTTAGKLAFQLKQAGKSVVLGAGDTFRAAAVEQLQTWADRIGVECIKPAKGANPAAVAFDAVAAGLSRNADEVIIDTAGRLHTKESLMEELGKVGRVVAKKVPGAPHRVLLVLDATLGQNALIQAKEFSSVIEATGVVLTKLDGSAKGGAALSVVSELGIPVVMVGVGESAEDLRPFAAEEFVENLIPNA